MMEVSIKNIKSIADDLQVAISAYKRQVDAYKAVCHDYKKMDRDGNDVKAMKRVLEELEEELVAVRKYRECLEDIIRCYEDTERGLINLSECTSGNNPSLKRIDIGTVRDVLDHYGIRIV